MPNARVGASLRSGKRRAHPRNLTLRWLSLLLEVIFDDPTLDHLPLLIGHIQKLLRLRLSGHAGGVIVGHVSLAAGGLEIIG